MGFKNQNISIESAQLPDFMEWFDLENRDDYSFPVSMSKIYEFIVGKQKNILSLYISLKKFKKIWYNSNCKNFKRWCGVWLKNPYLKKAKI